jgi:transposase-like protein
MAKADLENPFFTNEDAAWAHYETVRWPDGPVCAKCGSVNNATRLESKTVKRARKLKDGSTKEVSWTRRGVHRCKDCGEQFTATVGTIFEDSHIPMHKWLFAMHLVCASKKGMSAAQLHRMLGFGSYRTAWFMLHRIREAMAERGSVQKLGGEGSGGIVEADETYYGKVENPSEYTTKGHKFRRSKAGKGPSNKRAVVALIERGGKARVFHVATANKITVEKIVRENVAKEARLHTDESRLYPVVGKEFAAHERVHHSRGEYVRDDVHTNTAEGFFGIFKRGMYGVYHHCGERHLHRYLSEYEFRFNTRTKLGVTDKERAAIALKGTVGKRLTLHQPQNA